MRKLANEDKPQVVTAWSCILAVEGFPVEYYESIQKKIHVAPMIYSVRSDGLLDNPVLSHPPAAPKGIPMSSTRVLARQLQLQGIQGNAAKVVQFV